MTTNTAPAAKVFRVLGTTDDVTTCELCGKPELCGTVILGALDADGNVEGTAYYGSACAAKAAGWTTKAVRAGVKRAADEAAETARAERAAKAAAEYAASRLLLGTADCPSAPTICRIDRKGACVAHPA